MDIQDYISILWRRKIALFLTLITTMAVVVIGTIRTTPVYQASTTLRIAVSSGSVNYSDYMNADRLMNTYVNIATSSPVLEELKERLALVRSPKISAEIIPNTELITITVEDNDPAMTATIANTLADILVAQNSKLVTGGGKKLTDVLGPELTTIQDDLEKARHEYDALLAQTPAPESIDTAKQLLQLKQDNYVTLLAQYEQARFREELQGSMVTVFETALAPETPTRPRASINLALGFLIGLAGGVGLAFLFENLDTTLYEVDDIETVAKLPALVKIPRANKKQLNAFPEEFSPLAESFRNLATNLQVVDHHQSKRILLLMSAEPNQGKSMITFHLACSLAELGNNIVAVDCDTRVPRLHKFFQLPNQIGLKDVLEQQISLDDALQKSPFEGVQVLTSGSQPAHPTKMLNSAEMTKLIKSLKQKFDYVLLDSPAMLAVADASVLAPVADGLILVVRQAHAQREAVQAASNYLAGQNGKFSFLIVNEVKDNSHYYYYKPRKKEGYLLGLFKRISRKQVA